jgi:iron(III) transport system substrate-binding protein
MVQAFNKKYPGIKVNALRLSADKIPARVLTEQKAGKYNADVISGNSSYVGQLIDAGALEAYDPPDAAPLPEGTDLPDGFQSYTYVTTTAIAYNPTVLKQKGLPVPQTWEDLTKPAWKGQFSVNPGAVNWYDAMIVQMGHDKALALAKALGDNSPRLVSSHTQAVTQVQAGEPVATLMAYGYKAASLKKKTPDQLDFVNTVPLPTGVDMIDIAKNPPHPAAAKLFLDWIVSQDGQQTIVTLTNHTSLRSDVSNDKTVWDPSQWKPVWSRAHLPGDTFNQEAQELKAAFHAP